jgi:hypothetical protein
VVDCCHRGSCSSLLSSRLFAPYAPSATPPALVLFACRNLAPGMRRVDSYGFGVQFDVSEKDFTFRSWMGDMPPGRTYVVTLKDRKANMQISAIPTTLEEELTSAFPVFSEHVGESDVLAPTGRVVGKDRWGYLKSGERWRFVRFFWGARVGYRLTRTKEATLLDQVISSACVLPTADH